MTARLGSYEWARTTGGSLTRSERRVLIGRIARSYHELVVDRLRLAFGRVPEDAKRIDPDSIIAPDSKLAREAERAAAGQPEVVVGHAYRTWIFGTALGRLDGVEADPELFYVAALLHDAGIVEPTPGRDFTIASSEAAIEVVKRCGLDEVAAEAIGDGICGHISPGASVEREGPIAWCIQYGAVADLLGLRRCDISKDVRSDADSRHPRGEVRREISRMWRAESKAVPEGRAALLNRWAAFALAARAGPSGDG